GGDIPDDGDENPPGDGAVPLAAQFAQLKDSHFGEISWTGSGTSHVLVQRPRLFGSIEGPFVVDEGVAGVIHALMPSSTSAIVIGNGLSSIGVSNPPSEIRQPGAIILDEARMAMMGSAGLRGSVVLNAIGNPAPDLSELLMGDVRVFVPSPGSPPARLSFNGVASQPATYVPAYTTPGSVLGGGAIGIVPFDLRMQDCVPTTEGQQWPAKFLDSDFCHYRTGAGASPGAVLRYSGPVYYPNGSAAPALSVFRVNSPEDIDVTSSIVVDCSIGTRPDAPSRQVIVHSTPQAPLVPGDYYIVRNPVGGPTGLMCDTVLAANPVETNSFAKYYFNLASDCNRDGIADDIQLLEPYADVNEDGRLDMCQLYFDQHCIADFNLDGGVDGRDNELFWLLWEFGHPRADVNQDGGVDGGDVEPYMAAWQNGC
ncbi:MAG: hypothetical protein NTV94_05750, partial [Planctomycetota bacterium]|nr:hypothetical protein [Planctomycetota bacterium]